MPTAHLHLVSPLPVAGSHGHHGQLPAGEYLVTTSAHTLDASGCPAFLPWRPFLEFCIEQGLPFNDTWLVAGTPWAQAARDTLDGLALSGGPTVRSLQALGQLVQVRHEARWGMICSQLGTKYTLLSLALSCCRCML